MFDRLARLFEATSEGSGRIASWGMILVVLIVTAVVVLRYAFATGFVWLQELYVAIHGATFMLGAAYTLKHGGHVRIDVAYGRFGRGYRRWVDSLGVLFLLIPTLLLILWTSLPYVGDSWQRLEGSRQSGGLPGAFVLKSVIPLFCLLMLGQAVAMLIRTLQGRGPADDQVQH